MYRLHSKQIVTREMRVGEPPCVKTAVLACLIVFVAACAAPGPGPETTVTGSPLDWLLGEWHGVRRDGADGSEAPIHVRVTPILGGAGQAEELEVTLGDSLYRGFTVRMPADDAGRWIMLYMNSVRPGFVQLDGEIAAGKITWSSRQTDRPRRSRSVIEPMGADGFRRTMFMSEDQGSSWRVLWIDEVRHQ